MAPAPALPTTGPVYYFSDCQAGAATACVPGSNANAGTSAAAPRQNLSGFDVNALAAGSQLRFARGGAWTNFNLQLRNLNATPTQPLVLDSYLPAWGGTAPPVLQTASGNAINFGTYSDTVVDGGYAIRNLKFDGGGTAVWGLFLMGETRNVTLENNEITGFEIAAHFQNMGVVGNTALTIRNNHIHHNREMGMLGDANNLVIEGNTIANNNFSGSGFNHGLYLGGNAVNGIVRNNRFTNNSVVNGVCLGGNLTVHGQWDGLLIEGNTVTQALSASGCWGISINDGYPSAEFFRNVVVRGNTVRNLECALCIRSSPGIVIENNFITSNQPQLPTAIVVVPPNGSNDDPGLNPVVRNNIVCFVSPNLGAAPVRITVSGGSETGTVYRTGADATTGACAAAL